MKRRKFIAALLALPFVGKVLELFEGPERVPFSTTIRPTATVTYMNGQEQFLSFDTSVLPRGSVITSMELKANGAVLEGWVYRA